MCVCLPSHSFLISAVVLVLSGVLVSRFVRVSRFSPRCLLHAARCPSAYSYSPIALRELLLRRRRRLRWRRHEAFVFAVFWPKHKFPVLSLSSSFSVPASNATWRVHLRMLSTSHCRPSIRAPALQNQVTGEREGDSDIV